MFFDLMVEGVICWGCRMLRIKHCGPDPTWGVPGYLDVYRDGVRIVRVECNYLSPYHYAIQHKLGWFAQAIRAELLKVGVAPSLCDYLLKTGKYDERNKRGHCSAPEVLLSRVRAHNATMQHQRARLAKGFPVCCRKRRRPKKKQRKAI